MATRLSKMKIKEVSLVTRPAIAKEFLLYKSEDLAQEVPIVEEIVKTEEPVVEAVEPVAEPAIDCQKEAEPVVEAVPEPVVEKSEPIMCEECGKPMGDEEGKMHKDCMPVKKEFVDEISKALEQEKLEKAAIMKELEELKKFAYEAKQQEITKEYISKAAVDFKDVPAMVPAVFGPIMKAAADKLAKEEFDSIYAALKAASAFIAANSRLTKELGVGGEDLSADPAAQLDAIAKSYVSKDAKMTYAKAYEQACMNNPKLYAEHVRQARNR